MARTVNTSKTEVPELISDTGLAGTCAFWHVHLKVCVAISTRVDAAVTACDPSALDPPTATVTLFPAAVAGPNPTERARAAARASMVRRAMRGTAIRTLLLEQFRSRSAPRRT
jgi:hypothetical protein